VSAPHDADRRGTDRRDSTAVTAPQAYRGQQLGLPERGPGSLATTGVRLGAFLVDAVASALVAGLFVQAERGAGAAGHLPGSWSLIPFAVDYVVGMLVAGRTLGMYLLGLRVVRVDRHAAIDPFRAIARTVLLLLLLPAVIWDRDGRGLHDRLTDTAVVRA
jgi:uncharacterized RDD family membrane protein YckC